MGFDPGTSAFVYTLIRPRLTTRAQIPHVLYHPLLILKGVSAQP
jgi:hypothetical protein